MTQTIDQRARELLARQYNVGIADLIKSGAWDDRPATKEAIAALTEALTRVDELESALRTARDDFLRFRRGATNYNQQEGLWAAEKRCDQSLSRTTLSKGITE